AEGDAADESRLRGRRRQTAVPLGLWDGLRYAGRHRRPRLHPRRGSRRRPFEGARLLASGRRIHDIELRLRTRLQRPGSHPDGRNGRRPFDRKEGSAAPPGGSADFGRRGRQDPASARLDAALRRFANDCGERARLGAQARHRTLDDVASAAPEQKRRRIGRPRTLLGRVLFGLAVVTLPLLIAVGHAVLQLQQLADESEIVVTRSQTATLENQRIASQLADMERNARQYYA